MEYWSDVEARNAPGGEPPVHHSLRSFTITPPLQLCARKKCVIPQTPLYSPMSALPIPVGYHTVTPYLAVPDAQRLIDFMVKVFDAKEREIIRKPDGQIRHAEVQMGDSIIMLGTTSSTYGNATATLYVYVDDADARYQKALEAGATSISGPANQFYGDRHAGVKDPNGISWWIATHLEDVPPDEIARRARAAMENK
jgi:PhnB protein